MIERARKILERHGSETVSFQVLEPGLDYWFDGDAFVAYADTGTAWVAAGAPVAAPERAGEVMRSFCEAARAAGRRSSFFAVENPPSDATSFRHLQIGEQPFWDPSCWAEALRGKRSLREQLRRARAKGVVVRTVDADELAQGRPERRRLDDLLRRWQTSRAMAPMSFLVTLDVYGSADERLYLIAERDGELVGLLVAVPIYTRRGWFFEDVLRDPHAANGTVELLFDHGMRLAHERGIEVVTFGLAPLAGAPSRLLRGIRDHTRWLYDFAGLRAFKAKLLPRSWRPVYLVVPAGQQRYRAVIDALRAFAGGSFVAFGARTIAHRAPEICWLLAALLVPWVALLAAAGSSYFPSPTVQAAWIGFDALLFSGLTALSRRWMRGLAQLLCAAAVVDLCLGVAQASSFNGPRASGVGDWLVIGVALAAPLAAALVLGVSLDRQRLYSTTHESRDPEGRGSR